MSYPALAAEEQVRPPAQVQQTGVTCLLRSNRDVTLWPLRKAGKEKELNAQVFITHLSSSAGGLQHILLCLSPGAVYVAVDKTKYCNGYGEHSSPLYTSLL